MDCHHPDMSAAADEANATRAAGHVLTLARDAIKRELEAEARGLLMAARMHGFCVSVMHGTCTVVDSKAGA